MTKILFSFSSPKQEVLKVSCCGQSMSMQLQQFALEAYSSYIPGSIDTTLGRKNGSDLQIKNSYNHSDRKSKIAAILKKTYFALLLLN